MSMARWAIVLASLVACGGGPAPATAITVQPASAPTAANDAGAPERAPPQKPAGADGPRDARGMIGEAGALEQTPHRATLLVHSALVRKHPSARAMTQALTGLMSEWDAFMPYATVHPTRDLDWILVSGSLIAGSTQRNVHIARYNFGEPRADVATSELLAKLPEAKPLDVGVPGVQALSAHVDRARRAYVRPKPGLFAIVPVADGSRVADVLHTVSEPQVVRPGELFRLSYTSGPRLSMLGVLRNARNVRAWGEPDGPRVVVHAEAIYRDEQDAGAALFDAEQLVRELRAMPLVRIAFGAALERARFWKDGAIVRMRLGLEPDELARLGAAACAMPGGSVCVE